MWGDKNNPNLESLFLLQKKIIRTCTNLSLVGTHNTHFYRLKKLKTDIHNYNTRHVSDLHIAPTDTKLAENTFTTQGPIIWNKMNAALKNCKSLAMFKTCLKKYIIDQYSSEVCNSMYVSIIWSFTELYVMTVLYIVSDVVLHPNLNLIWFFPFFSLSFWFFPISHPSGTEPFIPGSLFAISLCSWSYICSRIHLYTVLTVEKQHCIGVLTALV